MEKCREQQRDLHIAFIDFSKAFDCVNRELLFKILGKLGCPSKFVSIIKSLYSDVHARLIIDGDEEIQINYPMTSQCGSFSSKNLSIISILSGLLGSLEPLFFLKNFILHLQINSL